MKVTSALALFFTAVVLAGCAGTDFKRPGPEAFALGKSTEADVTQVLGKPRQTGEVLQDGKKLHEIGYAYALNTGVGAYPGVIGARSQSYTFYNDVMVKNDFNSSFATDVTDFDENKVSQIVKGQSTKADVIKVFGKPTGEAIYPVAKNAGDDALLYTYSQVSGSAFNLKFYKKNLIVYLNANGVVAEVAYTSSGSKN